MFPPIKISIEVERDKGLLRVDVTARDCAAGHIILKTKGSRSWLQEKQAARYQEAGMKSLSFVPVYSLLTDDWTWLHDIHYFLNLKWNYSTYRKKCVYYSLTASGLILPRDDVIQHCFNNKENPLSACPAGTFDFYFAEVQLSAEQSALPPVFVSVSLQKPPPSVYQEVFKTISALTL